MNEVNAYCILDKKAKVYNQPYFLINDQVAIRQFHNIVTDSDGMIKKYPEDFILFRCGSFDTATGIIKPEEHPVPICCGLDFQKTEVK